MIFVRAFSGTTLAAALLASSSALALSADDLWKEMQQSAQGLGLSLQAETIVEGERQTLYRGLTLSPPGVPGKLTLSELTMVERDDGSLTLYPGLFGHSDRGANSTDASFSHENLTIDVSEAEGDRFYDLKAGRLDFQLNESVPSHTTIALNFEDVSGRFSSLATGYLIDTRFGQFATHMIESQPEISLEQRTDQTMSDFQMMMGLTLPTGVTIDSLSTPAGFAEAVRRGLGALFDGSTAEGWAKDSIQDELGARTLDYKLDSAKYSMVANADTVAFDVSANGLAGSLTFPIAPEPIEFSATSISEGFAFPIVAPNGGKAHLALKLEQLSVSEAGWAMLDPEQKIKREPFDLGIEARADVKLDAIEEMLASEEGRPSTVPTEFTAASITALNLAFGGASLTGTADFALKGAVVPPGPVPPTPIGTAEFKAVGVNQLIDALFATGLIPADQQTAVRLGLAMIAKPGANPDELVSSVEAKEDGQIIVNGTRVK